MTKFLIAVRVFFVMKKELPILITLAIILSPLLNPIYPVFAQDSTSSSTRKDRIEERAEKRIERLEDKKEKVVQRIETRQERIASKAAELKLKLDKFRDKRKATLAEKINQNLTLINTKRTTHFTNVLSNLEKILTRVETKVTEAGSQGVDTTAASTAVSNAKVAVQAAKTAIAAQVEKDYVIVVTTEKTIKEDSQATRDTLHTDLKNTRMKVQEARQAVNEAIRTAMSSIGGKTNGQ